MIERGWAPGTPGKALLIEDGNQLRLVAWEVGPDRLPHHLRAMVQLGLVEELDRIKAFLVIDSDGGFTTGRLGEGTSNQHVCDAASRLGLRLGSQGRRGQTLAR